MTQRTLSKRREAILTAATVQPEIGDEIAEKFGLDWLDKFLKKRIKVKDLEKITKRK